MMRDAARWLAGWALAFTLAVAAGGARGAADVKHLRVADGAATIPVTEYVGSGGSLRPCVFLLGDAHSGAAAYAGWAQALAQAGYNVYDIDYAASGKASAAAPWSELGAWSTAVRAVISSVSDEPGADPTRIGLLGFVRGAYLAVAVAAADPDISAVVELGGGVPGPLRASLGRLPPTLILHGGADRVVPASEARHLADALTASGSRYDIMIYPGAGHDFAAHVGKGVGHEALRRCIQFFDNNL